MIDLMFSKLDFDDTCAYMENKFAQNTESRKYRWVPLKPDFLGAWKSVWLISNLAYLL